MYLYPTDRELEEMRWDRPGPDPVPGVAYEYGALYPGPLHDEESVSSMRALQSDECPCPDCNPY